MRILSIHIDGFGNLKNADYVFSHGMNIKEVGTVWDRSAVSEFIVAMLFGLEGTEVLAPESLRDDYRQRLAAVQKAYGQQAQPKQKKEEQLSLFDDLF